jgi:hypothetical protein
MRRADRARVLMAAAMAALLAAPVLAQTQSAAALYRAGDYAAAIAAGETSADASELTAGAMAALADASLRDTPCLPCFRKAHALAARAIAADPMNARAYVYLVVTIGYEARLSSLSTRSRLGTEAKQAVDTALKLAPNDPFVLATAGGWQIELTRAVGGFLSRLMYGADFASGEASFKRALANDAMDATLQVQYALSLASTAFDDKRSDIRMALLAADAAPARDAYDAAMKMRASALLGLLNRNADAAFLALVRRYLVIS